MGAGFALAGLPKPEGGAPSTSMSYLGLSGGRGLSLGRVPSCGSLFRSTSGRSTPAASEDLADLPFPFPSVPFTSMGSLSLSVPRGQPDDMEGHDWLDHRGDMFGRAPYLPLVENLGHDDALLPVTVAHPATQEPILPTQLSGRKRALIRAPETARPAAGGPPSPTAAAAELPVAPLRQRPRKVRRNGTAADVAKPKRVVMLPPPPTFFDTSAPLDTEVWKSLASRVQKLVHGPENRKLGKYYGASEFCCERCRNIFKDHTKPFKRPPRDVRHVLRKLRLQACVDVGMRGYKTGESSRCTLSCCSRPDQRDTSVVVLHPDRTDSSGNVSNHDSSRTPLARDHECAAGRRVLELLEMVRPTSAQ